MSKRSTTEVEAHVQAALEDAECDLLLRIRAHLAEYLVQRPDTIRIDTTNLGEEASSMPPECTRPALMTQLRLSRPW
jgi:hypothetical protein